MYNIELKKEPMVFMCQLLILNYMDDFNMPAKDTYGSQPPLEMIRLWLDFGFCYDRKKQLVKYIKLFFLRIINNSNQ
jgi:hypothetical protein